jgi:uncharacterized protein
MTRIDVLARVMVLTVSVSAGACSSGTPAGGGAPGSGATTGAAGVGTTGAAGTGAAAGSGPGTAGTGTAGTGTTGAAGSAGTGSGAAGTGSAGATGAAGTTGAAGSGSAGAGPDGGSATDASNGGTTDASHGNKVLLYTRSTGFVHDSTLTAAMVIAKAAAAVGLVTETSADPLKFEPATLAQYAAVVLIATAGEPIGSPGATQIQTLYDWVHAGGGLVAIENANHAYEGSAIYMGLLGGDFAGHSGYGPDTCYRDGDHPSVARLPASFPVTDEIYYFTRFRVDNQVVLRCGSDKRPISWVRQEGAGRFFYTALGHDKQIWNNPPLVDGHVLPGLLWSMGRAVP